PVARQVYPHNDDSTHSQCEPSHRDPPDAMALTQTPDARLPFGGLASSYILWYVPIETRHLGAWGWNRSRHSTRRGARSWRSNGAGGSHRRRRSSPFANDSGSRPRGIIR